MVKRRVGRPTQAVLRASFNVSLTFPEQTILERLAFFLTINRGKNANRNDAFLYLINTAGALSLIHI